MPDTLSPAPPHRYQPYGSGRGCLNPEMDCDFDSRACQRCGRCKRHCPGDALIRAIEENEDDIARRCEGIGKAHAAPPAAPSAQPEQRGRIEVYDKRVTQIPVPAVPAAEDARQWAVEAAQEINRIQLARNHVLRHDGLIAPIMSVDEQVSIITKHVRSQTAALEAKAAELERHQREITGDGVNGRHP